VPETNFAANICPGAQIVVNGTIYDENRTSGTEILRGRAANGCDSIVHVNLTVDSLILIIQLRAANCRPQEGGQITFFSIDGGVPPYSVSVNSGPAVNIDPYPFLIDGLSAGVYNLTFADGNGCLYREPVTIPDNPLFNISSDTVVMIRRGQTIQLGHGFNFMADVIRWTPAAGLSCSDCLNPEVTPDFSTGYQVAAEFFGCTARQTVRILVDTRIPVFAPNAFSPNRDNINDRFTLFAAPEDVSRITALRIFDRWGGMVFEGKDLLPGDVESGWDGTNKGQPCNSGIYIFTAEVESAFGDTIVVKGEVNLMR
jgi:gliding motility-associated-like protein